MEQKVLQQEGERMQVVSGDTLAMGARRHWWEGCGELEGLMGIVEVPV